MFERRLKLSKRLARRFLQLRSPIPRMGTGVARSATELRAGTFLDLGDCFNYVIVIVFIRIYIFCGFYLCFLFSWFWLEVKVCFFSDCVYCINNIFRECSIIHLYSYSTTILKQQKSLRSVPVFCFHP